MESYNFKAIEKKWQDKWEETGAFHLSLIHILCNPATEVAFKTMHGNISPSNSPLSYFILT